MKKMKKIFLAFAVTLVSSIALTNNAAAQNDLGIREEDMPDLSQPLIINIPKSTTISNHPEINEHALSNFRKSHPSVTNEEWSATNDHRYLVSFVTGDTITIVGYNRNGTLHHTIKYYGEDNMPHEVRHIVKRVYYDYSIIRVAEVDINDPDAQTTYVVFIQDGNGIKKLVICNDEILEVQDTLKG